MKANFGRPRGSPVGNGGNGEAVKPANGGNGDASMRPPGMMEALTRVLLLSSSNTTEAARRHADWTILPRNTGVGLLEFHQIDQAIEAGRVAVREALEEAPDAIFARR